MRKPYFKTRGRSWWIKIDGKAIRLGKERDEAFAAWEALKAGKPATKKEKKPEPNTVGFIVGEFLEWTKDHCAPATYVWYQGYLAGKGSRPNHSFAQCYGHLRVTDLRKSDLVKWIDREFGEASENGRLGVKRAVMRCFKWAVEEDHCEKHPFVGVKIYSAPKNRVIATYQPRRTYLSPEQWKDLIAAVSPGDWLFDFLHFLRETGCRPHEARIVEARHFQRAARSLVIPNVEGKGKRDRFITLNDEALAIVERLVAKRPDGKLFRTARQRSLTKHRVATRMGELSHKLGFPAHAYILRRSYITDALANGETADILKTLVGHATTTMIDTVYSVLERKTACLVEAAKRARKGID